MYHREPHITQNSPRILNQYWADSLSVGRPLIGRFSMEVDLSAELSQPSAATIERQVARASQGEMRRQMEEESIKWRAAPTRGEEKQWATAKRYIGVYHPSLVQRLLPPEFCHLSFATRVLLFEFCRLSSAV